MSDKNELSVCCICGMDFIGYGNNAEPVKKGYCCNYCNYMEVIPRRLALLGKHEKKLYFGVDNLD